DPAWEKLWQETRQWSLDEMKVIFYELDAVIDRQYLESEVYERGLRIADDLLKKGVAKISEGAMVVDLEEKKLGMFLIRKSDGTSLYATKDLALAELKAEEYPSYARSLHLVDTRQAFYFGQLFETLRRMGFDKPLEYVGYELVTLKDGAMASRKGNIVTYADFRDAVIDYAKQEILSRHADWSEQRVEDVAWDIAMAGIKFGMLKQDSDKIYTFDLEQALSFDGATGPYCQYAAMRLGSILKKASQVTGNRLQVTSTTFDHLTEKQLAIALAKFPQVIEEAAEKLKPSVVANWCFETARAINAFYRDVPVLESTAEMREARLSFVAVARQTLTQGLSFLGISVPEEM
ncbi:MAG: arginine--tRNA ligase, partial [Candidatus Uhrbacteria bacterium]|nr:arginine--tRNA ligase [Candidatus Uhrbacteria bacterium]